jgi:hypothetical protein
MSAQKLMEKELRRKEHTGNTLSQTLSLLLAADRRLNERVEDRMHVVHINWGTSWACMGTVRVMNGMPP